MWWEIWERREEILEEMLDAMCVKGLWRRGLRAGAQAHIYLHGQLVVMVDRGEYGVYHSDINLHGGADPERVGEPCLVPAVDQGLPDVVCADDACYRDDDSQAEKDADADAVSKGHLEAHDEGDGKEGCHEIGDAVDDANN